MKTLEKSQDKIQKIAEELKKEAIEPAQQEAKRIIAEAQEEANRIIEQARKNAESLHQEASKKVEQERNVFNSSLEQASKQSLEFLKQSIENHLFNPTLKQELKVALNDPKPLAKLIEAIVKALDKEGISANLTAAVSKEVKPQEINALLGHSILERLKEKSVVLSDIEGGAEVKVYEQNLTLDISEKALEELLAQYVRKDFRKLFFAK